MAIKRSELQKYNANWPYSCIVKETTYELWLWLDGRKYGWDYIFEDNGDLSPDVWFGFKNKDDWTRFTLTWS